MSMSNPFASFDEYGPIVASNLILAKSEEAAVLLQALVAYWAGMEAILHVYSRHTFRTEIDELIHEDAGGGGFRIGFSFDGPPRLLAVATGTWDVGGIPAWHAGLIAGGGGGGDEPGTRYDLRLQLSQYPTGSSLIVGCSWPNKGIAPSRTNISVPTLRAVSSQILTIWS